MNLLDRAAALLPSDDPALGRLYTSLGAALTEAGQLEKARATLDHAQRIAAANDDEGQYAHARVQALLLGLKVDPNEAAMEITRALPELRREFDRSRDDLGHLPNPAARGRAALEPREIRRRRGRLAARRRVRAPRERPEAADRDTRLARLSRALGPDAGTGRDTAM